MRFGLSLTAALMLTAIAAAPLSAETTAEEDRRQIASAFVAEKLSLWQQRLKLQEWTISVVMTRRSDFKPGTLGKIRWDKGKKTATLWAMDAADYGSGTPEMLKDLEFTIVHELIHLELSSLPKSEASRRSEEFAVNQLAEALLALDRR